MFDLGVCFRKEPLGALRNGIDVGVRLRDADAWFKRPHNLQVMLDAVAFRLSVEYARRPHLDGVEREIEVRRRHADDGESFGVERQSLAHNARIGAEAADPEAMLEHDQLIASRLVFARLKRTAERRAGAERVEEVGRYVAAFES